MSLRIRVPNAQAASRMRRARANDPPTCAQSLEQRCTVYQGIERSCGIRRSRWRDPDSNRGHHDFQTGAGDPRTDANCPQRGRFGNEPGAGEQAGNCECLPEIPALVTPPSPTRYSGESQLRLNGKADADTPKTRQIGSTPKRARCSSMNALTSDGLRRARSRKTRRPL